MSKKDYQAVATIIHNAVKEFPAEAPVKTPGKTEWPGVLGVIVFELDGMFRRDNSAYDSARFLEACEGVPKRQAPSGLRCPARTCLPEDPCVHPGGRQ